MSVVRDIRAELAVDAVCVLGEGPVWWGDALWFVDIEGRSLNRFHPSERTLERHAVPSRIGFAVPSTRYGWVIAQDAGLVGVLPGETKPERLCEVEAPGSGTRLNDGKCDPTGRLYAGTMHLDVVEGAGSLYRLDSDTRAARVLGGVTISNGLAWSESDGMMYYVDTSTGRIDGFDWCAETGEIDGRRPVATVGDGAPDGMCIDGDGFLWVAVWGGSRVACIDPRTGDEVGAVRLPCPNVTSCCFGGERLDRLWITTARFGMDNGRLAAHPEAGGVFVADVGVAGRPTVPMA